MNVEEQLRAAVNDAVREVPPGFADGAMRRGRRSRRTARVAVGGGAAAAVMAAAALVVGVVGTDGPTTGIDPAGGGVVDLGELGIGPAPEVPWYEGGALHFGDSTTPYEYLGRPENPATIQRISGGYVVTQSEPDLTHATVTLVRDDGEQVVLATGLVEPPVVSADGERLAWAVQNEEVIRDTQQTFTTTVSVADAGGELLAELPASASPYASPAGFLADGRLALNAEVDGERGVHAWEVGDDAITQLPVGADLLAMSPAVGLGVYNDGDGAYVAADLATGEDLWLYEDGKNPSFSPDGRYIAGSDRPNAPDSPVELVLRDARTGDEVLRVAFEWIAHRRWESPTSIVLSVVQGTEAALVRCTVDGDCELATELRPADADPDTPDSPYLLGY
ncbi:TolB-like translocation protein [Jiangella alkaliphila]|uniref:WD40-like Beta Propeller Repeat n=1 Tax=Jiangella alkaliphila TaxID=419479 RepID=A0A1H2KFK3_9ACTN|nr:PD40 domain-containing protein [Jiangella alkaliphila]SDU67487.1 WD40-like Beta Propeller Repeat [Jiangella alkaliphila]